MLQSSTEVKRWGRCLRIKQCVTSTEKNDHVYVDQVKDVPWLSFFWKEDQQSKQAAFKMLVKEKGFVMDDVHVGTMDKEHLLNYGTGGLLHSGKPVKRE